MMKEKLRASSGGSHELSVALLVPGVMSCTGPSSALQILVEVFVQSEWLGLRFYASLTARYSKSSKSEGSPCQFVFSL
jgi:hypothetical protein